MLVVEIIQMWDAMCGCLRWWRVCDGDYDLSCDGVWVCGMRVGMRACPGVLRNERCCGVNL